MSNPIHTAYYAWMAADNAWHAELTRVFGKNAGDARYDQRGRSTPELARLHAEFDACNAAHRAACTANPQLVFGGPSK